MFEGIVNEFLDDSIEVVVDKVRGMLFAAGGREGDVTVAGPFHSLAEVGDVGGEGSLASVDGIEPAGDRSDALSDVFEVASHACDEGENFRRFVGSAFDPFDVEREGREFLDDVVVQFCAHFRCDLFAELCGLAGDAVIEIGVAVEEHRSCGNRK